MMQPTLTMIATGLVFGTVAAPGRTTPGGAATSADSHSGRNNPTGAVPSRNKADGN
jgi:hypothetical protein